MSLAQAAKHGAPRGRHPGRARRPQRDWHATAAAPNDAGGPQSPTTPWVPVPEVRPMTFNPNAQLDPSQVTDVRGRSMGGVGRGGGLAMGGGGLGLVIAIIYVLLGGNPGDLIGSSGGGSAPDVSGPNSSALAECKTGQQANEREDCAIVGYVNSIQAFWGTQVQGYEKAETVLFDGSISTGCGNATSEVGPFYCPVDK